MGTSIKKIIILTLCFAVLSGGFAVPQKTYATGTPTFDALLNGLTSSEMATNAANWASQLAQWAKDELAKSMRDQIVKAIVNEINKQTVEWIQGKGKPRFVTDWKGFVQKAGTEAVNQTISQSKLADLCTPFAPQLRVALIPETKPISQTARCTISDIVKNVQGFYDNFQNGGWLAYGEAIKPQNNLYMQLVSFNDETTVKAGISQEASKQDAAAGSGFLSVSACEESNDQELYNQCVMNSGPGMTPEQDSACRTYAAGAATCTKSTIQTPGDAVAGTVKNLIGSDNIYVSGVQSIISAAINAGVNRLMKEGLSLMTGAEHPEKGYNPGADFKRELDAFSAGTKNDLRGAITPTYERWKAILDIKQLSATYNTQLGTNLELISAMQSRDIKCPPTVTAAEQNFVIATAERITASIEALQPKVAEAEAILRQIDDMDTNNIRQSTLVNEAIKAFSAKYIADNPQNTEGTLAQQKQDAVNEQANINAKLDAAVVRLDTCKSAESTLFGGL